MFAIARMEDDESNYVLIDTIEAGSIVVSLGAATWSIAGRRCAYRIVVLTSSGRVGTTPGYYWLEVVP